MSTKRVRVTISANLTVDVDTCHMQITDAEAAQWAEDIVRDQIALDPKVQWDVSLQMEGEA